MELAKTWAAACRTAYEQRRYSCALREQSWLYTTEGLDPKSKEYAAAKTQLRRWRAYYRLWAMLIEYKIDPAEFCIAIAQYHAALRSRRKPNPASMSGECGRNIWWWWHEHTAHEIATKWIGHVNALRLEVRAGVASPEEHLRVVLRHAWVQCKQYGTREMVTLMWDPEIIWLLRLKEPAAKPVIKELLAQQNSEPVLKMREALCEIGNNIARQAWLVKQWSRVIGRGGTLREHLLTDAQLAQLAAQRASRERLAQLRAADQAQQDAEDLAQSEHARMARIRQRQRERAARQGVRP